MNLNIDIDEIQLWEVIQDAVKDAIQEDAWEAVADHVKRFVEDEAMDLLDREIWDMIEDSISSSDELVTTSEIADILQSHLVDFTGQFPDGLCSLGRAFKDAVNTVLDARFNEEITKAVSVTTRGKSVVLNVNGSISFLAPHETRSLANELLSAASIAEAATELD